VQCVPRDSECTEAVISRLVGLRHFHTLRFSIKPDCPLLRHLPFARFSGLWRWGGLETVAFLVSGRENNFTVARVEGVRSWNGRALDELVLSGWNGRTLAFNFQKLTHTMFVDGSCPKQCGYALGLIMGNLAQLPTYSPTEFCLFGELSSRYNLPSTLSTHCLEPTTDKPGDLLQTSTYSINPTRTPIRSECVRSGGCRLAVTDTRFQRATWRRPWSSFPGYSTSDRGSSLTLAS